MHVMGRASAIFYATRSRRKYHGRVRRPSDAEIEDLQQVECKCLINVSCLEEAIVDKDIRENMKNKIKFRKLPLAAWFMSLLCFAMAAFTIYHTLEDFARHRVHM
jgi:hypothetical protein